MRHLDLPVTREDYLTLAYLGRPTVGQASVEDTRRSARINAAHNDALAEGFAADTPGYFNYVEKFLDRPSRSTRSSHGSDDPEVNFIRPGEPTPAGRVRLTKGEYERSMDGSLTWNYGPRKGEPIGPKEYARRKIAMRATHPDRLA
jgi:hypothetical protein